MAASSFWERLTRCNTSDECSGGWTADAPASAAVEGNAALFIFLLVDDVIGQVKARRKLLKASPKLCFMCGIDCWWGAPNWWQDPRMGWGRARGIPRQFCESDRFSEGCPEGIHQGTGRQVAQDLPGVSVKFAEVCSNEARAHSHCSYLFQPG